MDRVAGPLYTLLAEKEGRIWFNIIFLKICQFKKITWWCFTVLEFFHELILEFTLQFVLLEKIVISKNLYQAHLLEVDLTQIPVDHAPLPTTCHVGLHVDFSSTNFFLNL